MHYWFNHIGLVMELERAGIIDSIDRVLNSLGYLDHMPQADITYRLQP
jgi:hypothetical protein